MYRLASSLAAAARGTKRLGASGWAGENNGLFEHPAGQARCYNGPAMKELATENIAIGVLASIGVLVLIVMFIYVVRQIITRKD